MKRALLALAFLATLLVAGGCDVECNDGTVHERNNKGNVVCQGRGGEKVKVGW